MDPTPSRPGTSSAPSVGAAGGTASATAAPPRREPRVLRAREHTVEIVSDSGEGAQKCGQIFGAVSAKMGNGVWTVEIIPAEIQPPARASPRGQRHPHPDRRDAGHQLGRRDQPGRRVQRAGAPRPPPRRTRSPTTRSLLIEDKWARHDDPDIRRPRGTTAMKELSTRALPHRPRAHGGGVPRRIVDDRAQGQEHVRPRHAGLHLRPRHGARSSDQIAYAVPRRRARRSTSRTSRCSSSGIAWAEEQPRLPRRGAGHADVDQPMVVMNGNEALGHGRDRLGHGTVRDVPDHAGDVGLALPRARSFERFGGIVHQAEDEIAAVGVAIGASYAGKVAFTVTSGPGLALKTEFLGPRGDDRDAAGRRGRAARRPEHRPARPRSSSPTCSPRSSAQPGDAPQVVIAPATIEECFHVMVTARRLAETFRCVVMVLSDANLATGVQPFPRPTLDARWQAAPLDLSPVRRGREALRLGPEDRPLATASSRAARAACTP